MDKKKSSNEERGNVRYLWVLVGAYLVYLAYQQLQLVLRGEAVKTGDVILCVVSGVVFAAVGAWVIYREWRAWRYPRTRTDEPETREDASEDDVASAYPDASELSEAEVDDKGDEADDEGVEADNDDGDDGDNESDDDEADEESDDDGESAKE